LSIRNRYSALDAAACTKNTSLVELLLKRGAAISEQVSFMSFAVECGHFFHLFKNQTFSLAVSGGCLSIMDLLLSAGVVK
jgi:hypothetical protein